MKRLFIYLRPYRRQFALATGSSVINKVFDLMPPIMVGWLIDTLSEKPPGWLPGQTSWEQVLVIAFIIAAVFSLESLFEWIFQLRFRSLAQHVQHDLRLELYDRVQHRRMAFFTQSRTGELLSLLNDDVNQLERFLNSGFVQILHLFVLLIFASITLFATNFWMGLVGVAAVPFIVYGSWLYQRIIGPRYLRMRETVGRLLSRLENNLSGIVVIKSFGSEAYEKERVATQSAAYRDANLSVVRVTSAYVPLVRTFITAGFVGSLLLGSYWYISGKQAVTLGDITLFAMMIQRLLWPVTRLGTILDDYERASASAQRIFDLFDRDETMPRAIAPKRPAPFRGELTFEKVGFAYANGQPTLRKLDLHLKAGETLGIAGPTGAGKTTLIKLILRFYDPTEGRILLDGVDARDWDLAYLRRHIALVSQESYVFHGTLRENIAYGAPETPPDQIEAAARRARLHDFVASLPAGYDTLVGERGIRLSGGQRQRLSIARAILKDAPLLILDEATSSVDSETEAAIQEQLDQLVADRTALLVAHRLSTLRTADRIVVLRDGCIIERGNHNSLVADEKGLYHSLWAVQTGERLGL